MRSDSCATVTSALAVTADSPDTADFVSDLSDDQLSDVLAGGAKWFMDYRNADGSLAEMCGNGTRAITLFAQREGVADSTEPFRLGTRAGVKILTPRGNMRPYGANVFQVEMGEWKIGETDAYEVTIPGTEARRAVRSWIWATRMWSR